MTKDQRISHALYRVANVAGYLSRNTKDLEALYAAAKTNERKANSKEAQVFYAQRQVDIMVALFVRRFYGLIG